MRKQVQFCPTAVWAGMSRKGAYWVLGTLANEGRQDLGRLLLSVAAQACCFIVALCGTWFSFRESWHLGTKWIFLASGSGTHIPLSTGARQIQVNEPVQNNGRESSRSQHLCLNGFNSNCMYKYGMCLCVIPHISLGRSSLFSSLPWKSPS